MTLEHAKTIGKHNVFVACLHHAREPTPFLCEKGLVVESGAVFYTTLWAHFPCTNHKTPRSISPIGNIPARAATQTRPASSWHEQCAIRQVFTYVHCVHMRSAIPLMYTTLHSCILNRQFHEYYIPCIPPTFTDPNCLRPTPIQFLLTVQQLVTPACYPGPAECAKRLNKMICHSIISPLQPQLDFARVCTSRLVNKCSSIMNRRNARSVIWRTLSLTTWSS